MATKGAAGIGRKRPQLDIDIDNLHLDPQNPRLPEEVQGGKEDEVLVHLYEKFDLEEIADSMSRNGYFDEEPLVVVPAKLPKALAKVDGESPEFRKFISTEGVKFVVAEGNRRLAAAKLLTDAELRKRLKIARSWETPAKEISKDLSLLPAIVYPRRKDVLPYLGVRHITGNKKWDSYAKARYINEMLKEGHTVDDIEQEVGDRAQSVRKNAISYNLLRIARDELEYDISRAKDDFSLLLLIIGQRAAKHFLGWFIRHGDKTQTLPLSEVDLANPVDEDHIENLRYLLLWLFGDGRKVKPAISESRDITNYLKTVLESSTALEHLKRTGNLQEAYELTDGEEVMVTKLLQTANVKLERALGVVHRHKKSEEVLAQVERCDENVKQLRKTVGEK